jgi:hypothetical protein
MAQSLRGYPNRVAPARFGSGATQRLQAPTPPTPANDNQPGGRNPLTPPSPANDNTPQRASQDMHRSARQTFKQTFRAARRLMRLFPHPAVRIANTAFDLYELWANGLSPYAGQWRVPGYTRVTICNRPINWQARAGREGSCLSLQAGGDPLGTTYNPAPSTLSLADRYSLAGGFRWATAEVWTRNPGTTTVTPEQVPMTATGPAVNLQPLRLPNFYPDLIPPSVPVEPMPVPRPLQRLKPYSQTYQGHHRNVSRRFRRGRAEPLKPYEVPATITEVVFAQQPTGNVSIRQNRVPASRGAHQRRPPGPREKETKWQGRTGAIVGFMTRWGFAPTEALDFLDAIYQALPEHIQSDPRNHGNAFKRARAVYENFDQLDMEQAAFNLSYNAVEDRLIGELNRRMGQFGRDKMGADEWRRFISKMSQSRGVLDGF